MSSTIENASEAVAVLRVIDSVLGVIELTRSQQSDSGEEEISLLCRAIDEARQRRDFSTADKHRNQLIELGYEVRSTSEGTVAKRKMI